MNKKILTLLILATLMISGCADVTDVDACILEGEHTYGFWGGTWHGMISGPSFIGSLIWDDISIYAINNNGAWYDFGFIGGLFFILKLIGLIGE